MMILYYCDILNSCSDQGHLISKAQERLNFISDSCADCAISWISMKTPKMLVALSMASCLPSDVSGRISPQLMGSGWESEKPSRPSTGKDLAWPISTSDQVWKGLKDNDQTTGYEWLWMAMNGYEWQCYPPFFASLLWFTVVYCTICYAFQIHGLPRNGALSLWSKDRATALGVVKFKATSTNSQGETNFQVPFCYYDTRIHQLCWLGSRGYANISVLFEVSYCSRDMVVWLGIDYGYIGVGQSLRLEVQLRLTSMKSSCKGPERRCQRSYREGAGDWIHKLHKQTWPLEIRVWSCSSKYMFDHAANQNGLMSQL